MLLSLTVTLDSKYGGLVEQGGDAPISMTKERGGRGVHFKLITTTVNIVRNILLSLLETDPAKYVGE